MHRRPSGVTLALSCCRDGLRAAASILERLTLRDGLHQTDRWCSLFCGVVGPCIRRTVSRSCLLFCSEDSSQAVEGSARGRGGRTGPAQPRAASGPAPQLAGIPLAGRHHKASPGPRAAGNTVGATPTFQPTPLGHLDVPTVVPRGSRGSQVFPPSPTPGLSQHQLRQSLRLQLRGGPGLGPCVQDNHPSPTCSLPSAGVEAGFR